uniref:Uncharacterized protein n=1 Tax=Arundo donax TaxID=35708 RepID=A0A0A9EII2_ARUDO
MQPGMIAHSHVDPDKAVCTN